MTNPDGFIGADLSDAPESVSLVDLDSLLSEAEQAIDRREADDARIESLITERGQLVEEKGRRDRTRTTDLSIIEGFNPFKGVNEKDVVRLKKITVRDPETRKRFGISISEDEASKLAQLKKKLRSLKKHEASDESVQVVAGKIREAIAYFEGRIAEDVVNMKVALVERKNCLRDRAGSHFEARNGSIDSRIAEIDSYPKVVSRIETRENAARLEREKFLDEKLKGMYTALQSVRDKNNGAIRRFEDFVGKGEFEIALKEFRRKGSSHERRKFFQNMRRPLETAVLIGMGRGQLRPQEIAPYMDDKSQGKRAYEDDFGILAEYLDKGEIDRMFRGKKAKSLKENVLSSSERAELIACAKTSQEAMMDFEEDTDWTLTQRDLLEQEASSPLWWMYKNIRKAVERKLKEEDYRKEEMSDVEWEKLMVNTTESRINHLMGLPENEKKKGYLFHLLKLLPEEGTPEVKKEVEEENKLEASEEGVFAVELEKGVTGLVKLTDKSYTKHGLTQYKLRLSSAGKETKRGKEYRESYDGRTYLANKLPGFVKAALNGQLGSEVENNEWIHRVIHVKKKAEHNRRCAKTNAAVEAVEALEERIRSFSGPIEAINRSDLDDEEVAEKVTAAKAALISLEIELGVKKAVVTKAAEREQEKAVKKQRKVAKDKKKNAKNGGNGGNGKKKKGR